MNIMVYGITCEGGERGHKKWNVEQPLIILIRKVWPSLTSQDNYSLSKSYQDALISYYAEVDQLYTFVLNSGIPFATAKAHIYIPTSAAYHLG